MKRLFKKTLAIQLMAISFLVLGGSTLMAQDQVVLDQL